MNVDWQTGRGAECAPAPRCGPDANERRPATAVPSDEPRRPWLWPLAIRSLRTGRDLASVPSRYRIIDARQVLHDQPPCPDIGVADFGISHLPFRQAHGAARGGEQRMRAIAHHALEIGMFASAMALSAPLSRQPHPSSTQRTAGRGRESAEPGGDDAVLIRTLSPGIARQDRNSC